MPPYPAAVYAGLFVRGATHAYIVESRRTDEDGEHVATGTITCTVAEVRQLPGAVASRVECDNPSAVFLVGDGPAGIYVASADGLWTVGEMPTTAPRAPTATSSRLLASPPVAGESETPDPANPGWGMRTVTSGSDATGWCVYTTWISGDEGDHAICVRDGLVTRGSASSSGAASYEMTYELTEAGGTAPRR